MINDFVTGKYCRLFFFFKKTRLYKYYSQRLVLFVHFLANYSEQNVLFQWPLLLSLLLSACYFFVFFLNFVFLPKHCKYVTVLDVSYGTWNSSSVNVFANKHHCTINKEWRQEATCLGCKMETSCLKVNK